jgi:SAM-dependent methyltransferase
MDDQWHQSNLDTWNKRAALHVQDAGGFYGVERFLAGGDMLHAIEASEIGIVAGKRLLHLQCHFGLDTLSLARRGALVTGLDFSPVAVAAAQDLSKRAKLDATFVEADVYDARTRIAGDFDIVYVTWGTICWLRDIRRWGAVVASMLAPGGHLYFADSHPSALVLDEKDGHLEPSFAWRTAPEEPDRFTEAASYTGDALPGGPSTSFNWIHPISAVIVSLLDAGLRLEFLHEHEAMPAKLFPSMVSDGAGMHRLPPGAVPIPLSFSLAARKPSRAATPASRLDRRRNRE